LLYEVHLMLSGCVQLTYVAADLGVDLGVRRIIKKKNHTSLSDKS
jgi:hypothetical protein